MVTILPCTCQHAYQNRVYGTGKRVFNSCEKGARCTVCGAVRDPRQDRAAVTLRKPGA